MNIKADFFEITVRENRFFTFFNQKNLNLFFIILAPLCPKPFTLTCLLLAARYPDIEVWRVSAGESGNLYDRNPLENHIACKAIFYKEE